MVWLTKLASQGVLAYVILRPLTSVIAFISALFHTYGDGQIRADKAYVYLTFINNVSQVCRLAPS